MSYTDEAVKAKLSALNDTQDSIVTVAQWVLFHKRYAERTAQLWFQRLRDSGAPKRLNLVYLANEVIQQSKARRKDDFLLAFSPIMAEATKVAYKGTSPEVQQKVRRVVEVWRNRQIFETHIQDSIEKEIELLDKERSSNKRPQLGGSLFSGNSSSVPPEIVEISTHQEGLSKASLSVQPALENADSEHAKLFESGQTSTSLPVRAAQLSGLVKSLAKAENAVSESLKARTALLQALEDLQNKNRQKLQEEQETISVLRERNEKAEREKNGVEDAIMQGLSAVDPVAQTQNGHGVDIGQGLKEGDSAPWQEPSRPDVEPLTPPALESTTPPYEPQELPVGLDNLEDGKAPEHEVVTQQHASSSVTADPRRAKVRPRHDSSSPLNGVTVNIKRRKSSNDEFGGFGLEGLDDDVVGMLDHKS